MSIAKYVLSCAIVYTGDRQVGQKVGPYLLQRRTAEFDIGIFLTGSTNM